jgi:hypothetical protein
VDFSTVYVPRGGLVHYKLVLDPESGDLRAAGVVRPEELATGAPSLTAWSGQLVLGLNAGLSHTQGVAGQDDELILAGDFTADMVVAYDRADHRFATILEITEGAEGEPTPFYTASDLIRLDLIYLYDITDRIGPYARVRVLASVFPSEETVDEDTTIRRLLLDGSSEDVEVPAGERFRTGDILHELELREGAGLNLRLVRSAIANIALRLGAGFRQNRFNRAFVEDDDLETPEIEYRQLDDFQQSGLESLLVGDVRFTRVLTYTTELEVFEDFESLEDPSLDWQNTLSLRLSSFAFVDYALDLLLEPLVTEELQISQELLLRFSWEVL